MAPPRSSKQPRAGRTSLATFGLGTFPILVTAISATAPALGQVDSYPLPGVPHKIVTADLNHDGATDIAVACDSGLSILLSQGGGVFAPAIEYPGGGTHIAGGDLDGDDDIDLVIHEGLYNDGRFRVFRNLGDGTFADAVEYTLKNLLGGTALIDVDGDRDLDYVAAVGDGWSESKRVIIHANDGLGNFSLLTTISQSVDRLTGMTAGDFDDDGDNDLVVSRQTYYGKYTGNVSELHFMFNNGDGVSWEQKNYKVPNSGDDFDGANYMPLAADFDGNTHLDVMTYQDFENTVRLELLLNSGLWQFNWGERPGGNRYGLQDIAAGDLDGDGDIDAISIRNDGGVRVMMLANRGDATFATQTIAFETEITGSVALDVDDVTGDGLMDIVFTATKPRSAIHIWTNPLVLDRPVLSSTELIQGQWATFTVTNLEPGQSAKFVYSLAGTGYSRGIPLLGGMTLDLNEPLIHFGSASADDSGKALLRTKVIGQSPLTTVAIQAVVRRGPGGEDSIKSNFITVPITDQ